MGNVSLKALEKSLNFFVQKRVRTMSLVILRFHCIDALKCCQRELKDACDTCFLQNKDVEGIGCLLACLVAL